MWNMVWKLYAVPVHVLHLDSLLFSWFLLKFESAFASPHAAHTLVCRCCWAPRAFRSAALLALLALLALFALLVLPALLYAESWNRTRGLMIKSHSLDRYTIKAGCQTSCVMCHVSGARC